MATMSPLNFQSYLLGEDIPPEQNPNRRSVPPAVTPVVPTTPKQRSAGAPILPQERPNPLLGNHGLADNVTEEQVTAALKPSPAFTQRVTKDAVGGVVGTGEAALGAITSIGGFLGGLVGAGSSLLNEAASQIAERGPITARTPGELVTSARPNFYTNLRKDFSSTIEKYGYSPRTEEGQKLLGVIGLVPHAIQSVADAGKAKLIEYGVSPNQADAIAFTTELLGFIALDKGIGASTRSIRSKVARYRGIVDKATSDADLTTPEAVQLADEISKAVQSDPTAMSELTAARQQLVSTLDKIRTQVPGRVTDTLRAAGERPAQSLVDVLKARESTAPVEPYAEGSIGWFSDPRITDQIKRTKLGEILGTEIVEPPTGTGRPYELVPLPDGRTGIRFSQATDVPGRTNAPPEAPLPASTVPPTTSTAPTAVPASSALAAALERVRVAEEAMTNAKGRSSRAKAATEFKAANAEAERLAKESEGTTGTPVPEATPKELAQITTSPEGVQTSAPVSVPQTPAITTPEVITRPTEQRIPDTPSKETTVPSTITQPATDTVSLLKDSTYDSFIREGGSTADVIAKRIGTTIPETFKIIQALIDEGKLRAVKIGEYTVYEPTTPQINTTPAIVKPKRAARKKVIKEATALEPQAPPVPAIDTYKGYRVASTSNGYKIYDPSGPMIHTVRTLDAVKQFIDSDSRPLGVPDEPFNITMPKTLADTPPTPPQVSTPPTTSYASTTSQSVRSLVNGETTPTTSSPEPSAAPIQIRYDGTAPTGILVDTSGLTTVTSLESLRRDVARGRLSPEVAQVMENQLRKQAEFAGVPLEQAHQYTGEKIFGDMLQLAQEKNLELYKAKRTKDGITYEQVPPEVIKTALQLERGNPLEPLALTSEDAATYVAEKTSPAGPEIVERIKRALQDGEDITNSLPEEIRPHFQDLQEIKQDGLNSSSRRAFKDIMRDILDVLAPGDQDPTKLGSLNIFGLTDAQKAAARRLFGDAQKAKKSFDEALRDAGVSDSERILFDRYVKGLRNPLPPSGIEPAYMQLDPTITNDRVVSQRSEMRTRSDGTKEQAYFAPIYESESNLLQQSKDLRGTRGTDFILNENSSFGKHNLTVPYFALRKADVLPIHYAYRASERAALRELRSIDGDLNALAKVHDKSSRVRIGEYGYGESLQGMNILIKNERDIPSLNKNEQITRAAQREFYDNAIERVNDVREATGKEPIHYDENYIPFMRVMSLAERLGIEMNIVQDSPAKIQAHFDQLSDMSFPRAKRRTGATYDAEFDSFVLMHDFARQVTQQIHMAPFLDKLKELITEPLPDAVPGRIDPVTGNPATWSLQEHRPGLYKFLVDWHEFLTHGVQPTFSPFFERAANNMMGKLSGSTLGLSFKAAVSQASVLKNVAHQTGYPHLVGGIGEFMGDALTYFFNPEGTRAHNAFRTSDVLDTRGIQDMYSDVSAAIIGRSPKDFWQAIKDGRYKEAAHQLDQQVSYKLMNALDMSSALITHNAARRLAEQINQTAVKEGRPIPLDANGTKHFIDNLIVRTNGGTMPGDIAAIQRTTGGRLATQFQRFLINDWNFIIEDVFGAAGRKDIARLLNRDPDRYLPAVVKSMIMFVAGTTAFSTAYELMGIPSVFPQPIKTLTQSVDAGDGPVKMAAKVAAELASDVPLVGRSRYGKVGPPLLSAIGEAAQSLVGAPRAYKMEHGGDDPGTYLTRLAGSPVAKLLGLRGSAQIGNFVRAEDRGQEFWPSLTGMYEPDSRGSGLQSLKSPGQGLRHLR